MRSVVFYSGIPNKGRGMIVNSESFFRYQYSYLCGVLLYTCVCTYFFYNYLFYHVNNERDPKENRQHD